MSEILPRPSDFSSEMASNAAVHSDGSEEGDLTFSRRTYPVLDRTAGISWRPRRLSAGGTGISETRGSRGQEGQRPGLGWLLA